MTTRMLTHPECVPSLLAYLQRSACEPGRRSRQAAVSGTRGAAQETQLCEEGEKKERKKKKETKEGNVNGKQANSCWTFRKSHRSGLQRILFWPTAPRRAATHTTPSCGCCTSCECVMREREGERDAHTHTHIHTHTHTHTHTHRYTAPHSRSG
jgi:hypothetical protein